MEKIKNINDHYVEILSGKDLEVPSIKSWELIKDRNKCNGNKIAFSEDDSRITYDEMYEQWDEAARVFSSLEIDRDRGSRVLTIMPNVAKTGIFTYSSDMTGAIIDFIDPTTPLDKIERYIKDENITDLIVSDLLYLQNMMGSSGKIRRTFGVKNIILYEDAFLTSLMPSKVRKLSSIIGAINKFNPNIIRYSDAVRNSRYVPINYDKESSDAVSLITHTSGTTTGMGRPIPLTDKNRNALVKNYELAQFDYEAGMKMMHFIPYFASYGAVNTTHLGLSQGMELQQIPLFTPNMFGDYLEKYKPNIILANPACWLNLISNPKYENIDLSDLLIAVSGGGPLTEMQEEQINKFLKEHGSKVLLTKGYGLSELGGCCVTTINGYNKIGSVGVRHPLMDVKVLDEANDSFFDDRVACSGEVYVNTDTMCKEELDGKRVIEVREEDGKRYLKTKDILSRDADGEFFYVDRKDRMFNRYDGYNVYPLNVEKVFLDYPEISDVFMTKLYDDECHGNVPKVYIELSDKTIDKKRLIEKIIRESFLSNKKGHTEYVANFREIPREFVFLDEIPKNTMGKSSESLLSDDTLSGETYCVNVEEDNLRVLSYKVSKKEKVKQKVKK